MLASIWLPVVYLLGAQWSVYPEYQYGWAVPFLCLFLAWQRWERGEWRVESGLESREPGAESREQTSEIGNRKSENGERARPGRLFPRPRGKFPNCQLPSSIFYLLLIFAGLVYWIMRVLQEANPVWRLASWGLAVSAVVMTLCALRLALVRGQRSEVRGPSSVLRSPISAFVFPTCFFLVAVPWPTPVESTIIQTLSRLNAALVAGVLNFLGVPALQHGNVIEVATGMVGISEACSGIRSFQATLMMALFFGAFYQLRAGRRWGLAAAGPALAAGFNFVRTFILVFVAARDGLPAMERWHDTTGVAILLGCFFCLWGLAVLLAKAEKLKAESGKHEMGSAPAPGAISRTPAENLRSPISDLPSPKRFQLSSFQNFSVSALALSLVVWAVLVEGSTEAWFRSHELRDGQAMTWTARWPVENPTLQTNIIPQPSLDILQCDAHSSAHWTSPDGTLWQAFFLRWFPADSFYGRTKEALSKCHNPAECLPAAGMRLVSKLDPVSLPVRPNLNLVFDRFVFDAGGRSLYVFFSQTEAMNGGGQINLRTTSLARLRAALAGSRNYGQNNFEVALAGPETAAEALRIFSARLPELIQFEGRKTEASSR